MKIGDTVFEIIRQIGQLFVYKTPFALLRPNYSIFEKIYLGQNVLHPKPVIWYLYIFFIRQLFVYFFAPDVPIGHHKDFLDLVFLPFYEL